MLGCMTILNIGGSAEINNCSFTTSFFGILLHPLSSSIVQHSYFTEISDSSIMLLRGSSLSISHSFFYHGQRGLQVEGAGVIASFLTFHHNSYTAVEIVDSTSLFRISSFMTLPLGFSSSRTLMSPLIIPSFKTYLLIMVVPFTLTSAQ